MIDLGRTRHLQDGAAGVSAPVRALRWWLGELDDAWSDIRVALRLAPAGDAVVVEASAEAFVVWRGAGPARRLLGRLKRPAREHASIDPNLWSALAGARGGIVVEVPAADTLTRSLRVPAASRADLSRLLRFELAKHLPFPVEEACWYFRDPGPQRASGFHEVEVTVAPLALVAAIRDELAALAVPVAAFVAADLPGAARAGTSFLAPSRPAGRGGAWLRNAALILALVAGAASLASPLLADHARLERLARESALLEPAASRGLAVREEAARDRERVEALRRLRAARPAAIETMALLSDAIADGSWLVSLSLTGSEIVLDGRSPSAAALAAALERTGRFERVTFRAPIARDPTTGLERFQISAILAEVAR